MGNQSTSQLKDALHRQEQQETQDQNKFIISPDEDYAILQEQSLAFKFENLIEKIQNLRKKIGIEDFSLIVESCPLYYLAEKKCYYQGQWLDCLPHGYGVVVYENNSYYEGEFERGELQGQFGFYYFNDHQDFTKSTYYLGKFALSKFNGKGKLFYKGIFYDGQWSQGKRHGAGKQYWRQKSYSFEGNFEHGKKDGEGHYSLIVGENNYQYIGQFKQNYFHGVGVICKDKEQIFKGNFLHGLIDGQGQMKLKSAKYVGEFRQNRINGNGRLVLEEVTKQLKGHFTDKIQNGRRKIYCQDKQVLVDDYFQFPLLTISLGAS